MLAGEIQTDHHDLHHEAMASLMYDEATCDAVFIVGHSTEAGSVSRADVDARGVPRTASAAPTSSKPPTVTADFGPRSVRRDSVGSDSFEEGGRVTDKRGAARRVGGLAGSAFDALRTDMASHEGFAAKKWIFKGHRALFAAKSTFFREALFESRTLMEASGLRKLELPNVSPRAFELIRHYVYTGRCTLSVDTVLELTAACCACELESLLIDCVNYALASLSVDNVCDMLITADVNEDDLHGGSAEAPQLKERCVEFICEHAQQVLETEGFLYLPDHLVAMLVQRDDLAAPEIDIFQAVSRWVHADQASRTSVAHDITQHLRLPLLSFRQIMKDVKPTGLVAMEQWLEALDYLSAADDPTFTKKTVSEHNAWMFTPRRAPVRDDSVRWSQASTALTVKNDGSTVQSWTSGWHGVLGEQVMTAGGVHTFSVRIDTKNNVGNDWEAIIGVASASSDVKQGDDVWSSVAGYIIGTGGKSDYGDGAGMPFATPAAQGSVVTVIYDADAESLEFLLDGKSLGVAFDSGIRPPVVPALAIDSRSTFTLV